MSPHNPYGDGRASKIINLLKKDAKSSYEYKNFIKLTLSITCNPKGFFQALKNFSSQDVYTNKQHIKDAAQWLLSSQNAHDDGGYSRHYSLYSKMG